MSVEWRSVEIEKACSLIVDCVNKTAPIVDQPTPFRMVRTTNIRNGRIDLSECRCVDKETFVKWTRRANVEDGDVLLTREAPIGEVGYVSGHGKIFLGQRIMQYRANPELLDSRFLLYAFLSPNLQHQFGAHEGSGSVVSHIRVGDCFKFKIPLPPIETQRDIARILASLDEKIELNRQINQALEQIAQTLFKSWFVDFEPVKAKIAAKAAGRDPERAAMCAISGKSEPELDQLPPEQYQQLAATAALFPDELVESELGLIPAGWDSQRLENILDLSYGKSLTKTERKDGDIPVYGSGGITGCHGRPLVSGPGIIVGRKGTVGTLYWEDRDFFAIDTVFYVEPKNGATMGFLFYLLKTLGLEGMNTDAAVPGLNRNNVYRLLVPKYPKNLMEAFSETIGSVRNKIFCGLREIDTLSILRDTLLPKLLSGELAVERKNE